MRLIDADALYHYWQREFYSFRDIGSQEVIESIKNAETIDIGELYKTISPSMNYCPICGAKISGKEGDAKCD